MGLNLDIDGWLRRIGLEQYAQAFRDNAIDADVLRDLTDDHLRELGLPLGARLKLLRAVATLGTSEQPPAAPEITPTAPRTDAERRQLTVMFVDLVGSTALSARLDPEDMRALVGAYHRSSPEQIPTVGGGSSPSIWATGCWPISAIHRPTSMTPNAPSLPGLRWSRRCRSSLRWPAHPCRCVSALRLGLSWSAI